MCLFDAFSNGELALIAKAVDTYYFYLSGVKDSLTEEEETVLDSLAEISAILHSQS